ncbi:thiamine diphosphate-binding protein [Aspergillus navahoensis]
MSEGVDVAFVTANRGFSNGIPGLASAPADRSPILIIISSPPLRDSENKSLQGIIDHVVVNQPLTKFAHRATILKMRRGWSVWPNAPAPRPQGPLNLPFIRSTNRKPHHRPRWRRMRFWAHSLAHILTPRAILKSTGALGFLGNGFGYALGATIAASGTKVINVQGDGSAGFHFMELDTCARLDLDVVTVVVNSYCWGMSSNG